MHPYNLKVWGYPLEELDAGWIDDRVALPDLDRIRDNIAQGRDDVSWGPNRRFRFPAAGGTGAIWSEVARLLPAERLAFGQRVVQIDFDARLVRLEDGQQHRFDVTSVRPAARRPHRPSRAHWRPDVRLASQIAALQLGARGGRWTPRGRPRELATGSLDVLPGVAAPITGSPCSPTTRRRTCRRATGTGR